VYQNIGWQQKLVKGRIASFQTTCGDTIVIGETVMYKQGRDQWTVHTAAILQTRRCNINIGKRIP